MIRRLLLVTALLVTALALAACTATPIPLPGADRGYAPPQDAAYGGHDAAPTRLDRGGTMPPPNRDGDAFKSCDLCWSGNCSDGGPCDGALGDGGRDGLGPGELGPGELGPAELGAKDAGVPVLDAKTATH
jgi:hypothetical protein